MWSFLYTSGPIAGFLKEDGAQRGHTSSARMGGRKDTAAKWGLCSYALGHKVDILYIRGALNWCPLNLQQPKVAPICLRSLGLKVGITDMLGSLASARLRELCGTLQKPRESGAC